MAEATFFISLTVITCSCGLTYAVPETWRVERTRDHKTFYCPNGCNRHYPGESDIDRLKREKEQTALGLQAKLNEANHARIVAEKARDKAVRDKRKVERRIAHGVCPCCNKTFADVSQHMITEHKDFRLPGGKPQKQIAGAVQ